MAQENNDLLVFCDEGNEEAVASKGHAWHVLVVDDDYEMHSVTRLALKDFEFANRPLEIHSAFSAAEARELLSGGIEFSTAIVDVVMETEHAGLELVKWIREEADNQKIRIILRTGQPGQAPERQVISSYDINDYKEKTELTSNKLYTVMHNCLRSFRDIDTLMKNKEGLELIIRSTRKIFAHQSLSEFTQGALSQLSALLHIDTGAFFSEVNSLAAFQTVDGSKILAATGRFSAFLGRSLNEALANSSVDRAEFERLLEEGGQVFGKNYYIGVYDSHLQRKNLLFLEGLEEIDELDRNLAHIFGSNVGVAFDNQAMFAEVEATQSEMVYRLGEVVESVSKETGNHVRRMAMSCRLLAEKAGLNDHEVEVIFKASPLHDIGKIAIPQRILNKPGKLDADEWEVMKTHAQKGYDLLSTSNLEVLQAGATIAVTHHENWDGSGYPNGLTGEKIPLFGRIAAIADVWDALINRRCYKEPWPIDRVIDFFDEMKGKKFDPNLIELMLPYQEELMEIQAAYSDDKRV